MSLMDQSERLQHCERLMVIMLPFISPANYQSALTEFQSFIATLRDEQRDAVQPDHSLLDVYNQSGSAPASITEF